MTSLPLLSAPSSPSSSAVSGVNVVTADVSLEFFSVVVFKMRSARLHRPRLLLWVYVSEPDLSRHNQETKGNDSDEPGHTEVPSRWQTDGSVQTGSSCVLKQEVIETVWSLSHTQIHKLLLYFLFAVVTLKHNSVLYMVKSDCTDDGDQVQILLWY